MCVKHKWQIPSDQRMLYHPSPVLVVDDIQRFSMSALQQLMKHLVCYIHTRMTVVVGDVCVDVGGHGGGHRVLNCDYLPPNQQDMQDIYKSNFGFRFPVTFEEVHLPSLCGGLVQALVDVSQTANDLTADNDPIKVLESAAKSLYNGNETPGFLLRAAFADVPFQQGHLEGALKNAGNISIGALEVTQDASCHWSERKFTIPPILVSSGCLVLPDVQDAESHKKFTHGIIGGFAHPKWQKMDELAVLAPALRLSALSYCLFTSGQIRSSKPRVDSFLTTYPFQMVFSLQHCTATAKELVRTTLTKSDLKVHWCYGGVKRGDVDFDRVKSLVKHGTIVVITMHPAASATSGNYLAIPTTRGSGILLVCVAAEFTSEGSGSDDLDLNKHIRPKVTHIHDWIPKDLPSLIVFATNKKIGTQMGKQLEKNYPSTAIATCNNLVNLFGANLIPPRYRESNPE